MLQGIRTFASSLVGKIIFVILLLAFGSGFWYFGDPFSGDADTRWAVRVGDVEIPPQQLSNLYQRELARLRATSGGRIDAQQARALGLGDAVIAQAVGRTLLDQAAADLGIVAGDDSVRDTILADPSFRGPAGTFDRDLFRRTLAASGFGERQYEQLVRDGLIRAQLTNGVRAAVAAPRAMVDAMYRYRNEKRTADVVRIADAAMTGLTPPDEAALIAHHQRHAARYTQPEFRGLTTVVLLLDALAGEIAVADPEIEAAYGERAAEFGRPERRAVRQIIVDDEATARRAHERLQAGAEFAAVAADEAGLDADSLDLGSVGRDDLPPELAEAAFALAPGGLTAPVRSSFGWHILQVTAIEPAAQRSLADVRDALKASLARDKAVDALYQLSARLEDALGGGASLEEAANRLALPVRRIDAVDAEGRAPDGTPVADLPAAIVGAAFTLDLGAESRLTDLEDEGFFVVRVDSVVPPALKPLDSVRDAVAAAVVAERRSEAGKVLADRLAEQLRGRSDVAAVAREHGLEAITTQPFDRNRTGAGDAVPATLVGPLFEAAVDTSVVVRGDDAWFVARVRSVIAADPDADDAGRDRLAGELAAAVADDVVEQMLAVLRQRYPVTVNARVVDTLF
jgi:peptidyl-prolyl cis-trans isomerase D